MTVLVVLIYLYPGGGGAKPKECIISTCPSAQNPAQEEGEKTASEVGIRGRPAGGPGISFVVVGTQMLGQLTPVLPSCFHFSLFFFLNLYDSLLTSC